MKQASRSADQITRQKLPIPSQVELERQKREFEAAWWWMTGRGFERLIVSKPRG